jgi:chemosensory pili system protein ChpC
MQSVREVYSLLMPIQGSRIIVPRAAVAEVMGYTKPKERPEGAPAFVLGYVEWQGQRIPLVSFEAARGGDVPELGRRTRIAVVFGIADRLKPNVFAVVTQGYPYLVRVNENVLHREEMESEEPLVLARVRMANEKPFVPDLERLELLIAEGLGIEAAAGEAVATADTVDELDAIELGDEEEFGSALLENSEDDASDETPLSSDGALDTSAEIDLGEVTSFGTETNYSSEMDTLEIALGDDETTPESDETDLAPVNLDEVTAFGADTNYSSELDELSGALQDDAKPGETTADDYAIDLSGLEVESDTDEPSDDIEFDLSDLEIDLGDEEGKP